MSSKPVRKSKLPSKSVALSITALLLVVTFATVVTIVDSDASYDVENIIVPEDEKILLKHNDNIVVGETATWRSTIVGDAMNVFWPSETGGNYMLDLDAAIVNRSNVTVQTPIISGDVRHVVLTTAINPKYIDYTVYFADESKKAFRFKEMSPGVWTIDITTVEALHIRTGVGETLTFDFAGQPLSGGILDFSIDMYGDDVPVYYASVLALVFGCILIVCALFATPWLSIPQIQQGYKNIGNSMKERSRRKAEYRKKKQEAKLWKY